MCKRLQLSDQTFYRWRLKYGAIKEDETSRLKALEQENARLKRIVAEKAVDISMLKDLQRGMVSPLVSIHGHDERFFARLGMPVRVSATPCGPQRVSEGGLKPPRPEGH